MGIARAYIAKLLSTVDELEDAVKSLSEKIAVLNERADRVKAIDHILAIHDRKIAGLEATVYGSRKSIEVPA